MMKKSSTLTFLMLSFESAILMSIPFLVPHTGMIALIAFIPILYLDKLLSEFHRKHAFLYIYLTFLLFNIFTTWWIFNVSKGGAIAAIILNALQMAAVFAMYRGSKKRLGSIASLIFLAAAWVAWEHVYFSTEIAWPWLCLGNSLASSPELAQWYDTFGAVGGSAWIMLCNILVFMVLTESKRRLRYGIVAAVAIFVPVVVSEIEYHSYEEKSDPIEVVVTQPNIDPFMKFGGIKQEEIDNGLFDLADPYMTDNTEFLFAPETFTYNIDIDKPFENNSVPIYASKMAKYPGAAFVFGAVGYRFYRTAMQPTVSAKPIKKGYWYDSFNLAMVMDSSSVGGYSVKSKLVPGAERIPYAKYLKFLAPLFENMGGTASSYGSVAEINSIGMENHRKTAVMICYETVFGDYCRNAVKDGAEFMAGITNDGWWGNTPGHTQHFNYARLRAIEYRRDLVHVANTGTSGIINQRGDVVIATPWWERTAFNATINGNDAITHFVKRGDVVGRLCCDYFLIMVFVIVFLCVSDRRFSCGKSA